MTDRLITHLRHLDLAVPDHDTQLDFYTNTWGLKAEHPDTGLTFLAAEGSFNDPDKGLFVAPPV